MDNSSLDEIEILNRRAEFISQSLELREYLKELLVDSEDCDQQVDLTDNIGCEYILEDLQEGGIQYW